MATEASRTGSSQNTAGARHVVFAIGGRALALPVDSVREVVDMREPLRVPAAPPGVLGITSLRGTILAVIDGAHLLSGEPSAVPPTKILVVVRDDEVLTGLAVDRVASVTALPSREPLRDHATANDPLIAGHHDLGDGELVAVLDVNRLYRQIEGRRVATTAHRELPPSDQELGR